MASPGSILDATLVIVLTFGETILARLVLGDPYGGDLNVSPRITCNSLLLAKIARWFC